jgi:hypothetical protein
MDYSRFNYLVQPEDGVDLEDLIPKVGPYDKYAIRWGYTPIPGAKTPDDEWPTLDKWSREQDQTPWYRFNMSDSRGADPSDQNEAVGDADPVKATGWGLKSIQQIVPLLVPATVKPGEDFDDLTELYGRLVNQWATEMRHVAIVVGGVQAQEKYGGQDGPRYIPQPAAKQREAVRFLNENAFTTPTYFLRDDILRRIEVEGALQRINTAQTSVLNALLNDRRLERVVEFAALARNPADAYPLSALLEDLRSGLFSELTAQSVTIDPFRRELQRSYIGIVRTKINPPAPAAGTTAPAGGRGGGAGPARATSDVRALFRSELRALDGELERAIPRAANREVRAHLEDLRDEIKTILEGRQPGQ